MAAAGVRRLDRCLTVGLQPARETGPEPPCTACREYRGTGLHSADVYSILLPASINPIANLGVESLAWKGKHESEEHPDLSG